MSTECYPDRDAAACDGSCIATTWRWARARRAWPGKHQSGPVRKVVWRGAAGWLWMRPAAASAHAGALADALERQSVEFGAGTVALGNIAKLRAGARAVVTGQQVGLFGGPLYVLLKAATAIARAKQASAATGVEHVPVFWLAIEDHDLEEVDQVSLLASAKTGSAVETLRLGVRSHEEPVGGVVLGDGVDALLERASELLGYAPVCNLAARVLLYRMGTFWRGVCAADGSAVRG